MTNGGFTGIRGTLDRTFTLGESLAWLGVLLALLVLGAHFFRAGETVMVLGVAGMVTFHCAASAWKTCAVGLFLVWGVLEWGAGVHSLIALRMHFGAPWLRGALILAAVAALTALAAAHVLAKARKKRLEIPDEPAFSQAAAFILAFLALYALRQYGRADLFLLEALFPAWGGIQLFLLAWYAGFVTGKLLTPRTSRKTRKTVWIVFSCFFFGQLALGLAGVPGFTGFGKPHIPVPGMILFAPLYRGSLSMMLFLVLAACLLAGSAWCSMLCYFGSIEAATSGKAVRQTPPLLAAALRHGRAGVLAIGAATALGLRFAGVGTDIAIGLGLAFAVASLAAALFLSRRYTGMAHCAAVCPMGLAVNLLGRLSPWRLGIDRERCDGCGACEKVCGYRAIDAGRRLAGTASFRCSLCRDCIAVCSRKAIRIKSPLLPASVSGHVFVVVTVTLHVLFLAAARPM